MNEPLTPEARRKPECAGEPIVLSDGQTWLVRRPEEVWVPGDSGLMQQFDLGPEYDAIFAELVKHESAIGSGDTAVRAENYKAYKNAQSLIFQALLSANYRLDLEDFQKLLRLKFRTAREGRETSDGRRIYDELWAIVLDDDPPEKPSPGGST